MRTGGMVAAFRLNITEWDFSMKTERPRSLLEVFARSARASHPSAVSGRNHPGGISGI